jgi:hypothetical protein
MSDLRSRVVAELEEIGLGHEIGADRHVSSRIPTRLRGDLAILIEVAERSAVIKVFILRAPDRHAEAVYRRALRRNLEGSAWRFAVDDDGDLFLVARIELRPPQELQLDAVLGELSVLVDETYEGLMRTGFEVPAGARVGPPPGGGP